LVGVFHRVSQSIEDRDARPVTVDEDINGAKRTTTVTGPSAVAVAGSNSIEWVLTRKSHQWGGRGIPDGSWVRFPGL